MHFTSPTNTVTNEKRGQDSGLATLTCPKNMLTIMASCYHTLSLLSVACKDEPYQPLQLDENAFVVIKEMTGAWIISSASP